MKNEERRLEVLKDLKIWKFGLFLMGFWGKES